MHKQISINKSYKFDCPYWLWPNVLSFDAPLIAIFWQEGFAVSIGVELGLINLENKL